MSLRPCPVTRDNGSVAPHRGAAPVNGLFVGVASVVVTLAVGRLILHAGRDLPFPIVAAVPCVFAIAGLSALLRGRSRRLGSMRDTAAHGDLVDHVFLGLINMTDCDANDDPLQHLKATSSPTMTALFRGLDVAGGTMFDDADRPGGFVQGGLRAAQDLAAAVAGR